MNDDSPNIEDVTLRDLFAMHALQGLLAGMPRTMRDDAEVHEIAGHAYGLADAALAARDKKD